MKYLVLFVLILAVSLIAREAVFLSDGEVYSNTLYGTTPDTAVFSVSYLHSKFGAEAIAEYVSASDTDATVIATYRTLQKRSNYNRRAGSPWRPIPWLTGAGTGAWANSKTISLTPADSVGYGALWSTYDPDSLVGIGEDGFDPEACEFIEIIFTPSDTVKIPHFILGAQRN